MIVNYDNQASQVSQNRRLVPKRLRKVVEPGDRDGSSDIGNFSLEPSDIEFFHPPRQQAYQSNFSQADLTRRQEVLTALDGCRLLSLETPPPRPPTILSIGGRRVGEAGNLVQVQGQAKSGKTAIIGAILGVSAGGNGDCFGLESSNPERKAVLHFDTEQSRCDHFDLVARAVRQRGRLHNLPEYLRSYTLLRLDVKTRRLAIKEEMARAAQIHAGIHLVVIDGVADISLDPNDAEECFAIVAELHALADLYQCVIVLVLHENPNSETGKTRGHLGSQLERKAQTSIVIERGVDEIVSMYARQARSCHWPKSEAVYFQFDKDEEMHVTVPDPTARRAAIKIAAKRKELQVLADKVCSSPMRHCDLIQAIKAAEGIEKTAAKTRINFMVDNGILEIDGTRKYQPANWEVTQDACDGPE